MSYYQIEQVEPWLYCFRDPLEDFPLNSYLLIGREKALLFDTCYGISSLKTAIGKITDKPLTVVLSHGHIDHANGAFDFSSAWIHEADLEVFNTNTSLEYRRGLTKGAVEKEFPGFDPEVYLAKKCPTLHYLTRDQEFDLGGLTCEVIQMPGHTQGSVGLLVKEEKILLTSDAASNFVWLFLDESLPLTTYRETLKRTNELDFTHFYTGHGDQKYPKSDFDKFIQVAENVNLEQAEIYTDAPGDWYEPYKYEEDGYVLVVNKRTLGL